MISEEISRRLAALKQAAVDFNQMISLIDGNFDTKLAEIKTMELKKEKATQEFQEMNNRATSILQHATDEASTIRKEAVRLLEEARIEKQQAKEIIDESEKKRATADALHQQALQKQKEADVQYVLNKEREKKILDSLR